MSILPLLLVDISNDAIVALATMGLGIVNLITLVVTHLIAQKERAAATTKIDTVATTAAAAYAEANTVNQKIAAVGGVRRVGNVSDRRADDPPPPPPPDSSTPPPTPALP
jgi:hypothetical protein